MAKKRVVNKAQPKTSRETSSSEKSASTTDSQVSRLAKENGILDKNQSAQASNIDKIRAILKRSRDSPPPEPKDFKKFCRKIRVAQNESGIQRAVLPLLQEYDDENYEQLTNQRFTRFPTNVGFNNGLSAAKPDFIEDYLDESFNPYFLRSRLGGAAVPTPGDCPIALPHFAREFKRYGGDFKCGTCQAAYDAASLVYGRKQASTTMDKKDQANAAYVGTFVCDGDRLLISVHYSSKDALGKTVYHQCPVFDRSIRMDHESFAHGRQHLRNLQDWAKENACSTKDGLMFHYQKSEALTKEQESLGELEDDGDFPQCERGANDVT